jgi:hypothetical protein
MNRRAFGQSHAPQYLRQVQAQPFFFLFFSQSVAKPGLFLPSAFRKPLQSGYREHLQTSR